MDWIKKNSEKFSLLVLSIALLGAAIFLFINVQGFLGGFADLKNPAPENDKMPSLETKSIDAAQVSLDKPATWGQHNVEGSGTGVLFVSRPMIVAESGTLVSPIRIDHPPITSDWIQKYHLDPVDRELNSEDPDGDGFTNEEEFKGGTDPTDPKSHPAYTTKLKLEQWIQVPFRLKFEGQPDTNSFQIDTVDVHQPTQILQMGDAIAGTKFKIVNFKKKSHKDPNDVEVDDSELTVENVETHEKVILIIDKIANSPDTYAKFKYLWNGTTEFTVKLNGTFSLKPETDVSYKLIDINAKEAKIQNLKTNAEIIIPSL